MVGRDRELAAIGDWLRAAIGAPRPPAADPGSRPADAVAPLLTIEGVPGIGKTTLWTEAVRRARLLGCLALSCRPVPSDAGLPHAGLTDLLGPVPDEAFGRLPGPQRRALGVALLREEADGDLDPRAVGTGLTALLEAVAEDGPMLVAIDDAQWLDPASARALAFALRRLGGRQVAVLAAIRTESAGGPPGSAFALVESALAGQARQRLEVGPLSVAAVHAMFRQVLGGSFPRPLLVAIHRAAGGNAFYALEIGRELRRTGNPPPGKPLPVPGDSDLALLRMRRLPRAARDALAALAAMPGAAAADVDLAALAPAERAGIATVRQDGRVEFTHPLFGSALYSSLPEAERRALHARLAARARSTEERARHLALAADGPDEETAAALDDAARQARGRGAIDTAVELTELARRLTPGGDTAAMIRRGTELADLHYFAGDPAAARRELEALLAKVPAGDERAQIMLELGSIRWVQGEADAGRELMRAALEQAQTPGLRARIHARLSAGADDADLTLEHAEAALALLNEHDDPELYSFTLHMATLFRLYAGHGADHAAIEKGMRMQRAATGWDVSPVPAFWARNFDDFDTARERFESVIAVLREQGDQAQECAALANLAAVECMTGHMDRARAVAAEALDLAGQTEQVAYRDVALCAVGQVHAQAGELDQARAAAGELLGRLQAHPDLVLESMARAVLGLAALTAGDLAEADRELSRTDEIEQLVHNREPANQRSQADHAEAVIGLGDTGRGEELVRRLEARAQALPRPWILAVSARCRGLLNAAAGDLDAALADYQRALTAHQNLDMPAEHGRTLLALGRLRRRRNERQQAQECLTRAVTELEAAGALGWAAVARGELARAEARRVATEALTPTERQICELAASGLRNHEIAARLFLSGKTVEANLSRGYRKLGIRSRAELAVAMARADRRDAGKP